MKGLAVGAIAAAGVLAAACTPLAAQDRVAFRQLTISDGLSQGAISAIVQDSRGFMWFGTKDGLNRYDGHEFVVFRRDPLDSTSLSTSDISTLFEDSRKRLWVGTRGGGINRFDRARERFARIAVGPTRDAHGFAEDRDGSIWVAAGNEGLFRLTAKGQDTVTAERFVHSATDGSSLSSGRVRAVLVDRRGDLWVGTDSGLSRRVPGLGRTVAFTHISSRSDAPKRLIDQTVSALHEDARGRLWIGSTPGVTVLDSARQNTRSYYHRYRTFRYGWGEAIGFVEDRAGALWITTRSELMRLDPASGAFTYIRHDPLDGSSINSNLPTAIYRDRSDLIWIGTNGYGINVHDPKAERFHTYRRDDTWTSRLSGFSVYTLFEDHAGLLWIDAGLLYQWNRRSNALRSFETTSDRPNDFGNTGVWSVIEESPGVLWAATYQGLYRYETASGRSRLYKHDPADIAGLPEQGVFDVFRDRDGAIWAVTENYLTRLIDPVRGRFDRWRHKDVETQRQWIFPSLMQDRQGALWLGSDQGVSRFDIRTATFTRYRHDPSDPESLSHDVIRAIHPDPRQPDRYLWIGTAGGGLNRLDVNTGRFASYTERDGLPNNVVYGVLSDAGGRLWISTNKGLSRFTPATAQFRNFDANDGLQGNEFNSGAAFRSRNGELFFGGTEGFSYFRPEAVTDNPHVPPVAITGFRRGNRYETVRDSGTVLRASISEVDTLHLSYQDAVITFEFAALEYSAPAKNRYAYRLQGFNNEWFESGSSRAATYTNLPPGRYTFQVKASNNDGVWNQTGRSLVVTIAPPWWRTPWAYALYAALAVAILTLARRYDVGRVRLAGQLEMELRETEQLRRLDRARSQLFADVSHEFRTPLTLTIGPLDDLRSGAHGTLSASAAAQVELARRNAGRVLDLVNEVLELARAEAGRVTVRAQQIEMGAFLADVYRSFIPLAERTGVSFSAQSLLTPVFVVADPALLERALSNVLVNAFKFTPAGGEVRVQVATVPSGLEIVVRDTGLGIPADEVDRIFDRFHRSPSTASSHPGTGIGLALARELLLLMGGSIAAERNEGDGSTFRITVPSAAPNRLSMDSAQAAIDSGSTNLALPNAGAAASALTAIARDTIASGTIDPFSAAPGSDEDVTTVLVVDDNDEIRDYVAQHLAPHYRVLQAADGRQGLDLARRHLPDLVLSDVMMPVMDGLALCRALKSDMETDFIPVVLLTARADAEDRLRGLGERADDYLTKPFNSAELLARIRNTIATRRLLRERYSRPDVTQAMPFDISDAAEGVTTSNAAGDLVSPDQRLLDLVDASIAANLGDDSFSVERLAADVAQSRSNLHRRLRELIGDTPSDLIRRKRLERAVELLDADEGTVAEVAYAVGFKSVAHFSNAYLEHHGERPSARRARARPTERAAPVLPG